MKFKNNKSWISDNSNRRLINICVRCVIMAFVCLCIPSCKPHPLGPSMGQLVWKVHHSVDHDSLHLDTIRYINQSANIYSVNRLQYYLSSFLFFRLDGSYFRSEGVYFVDALSGQGVEFRIDSIPYGQYHSCRFFIGLPPDINQSYGLPNTMENINMAWPDGMGGGYHFLKLEGRVHTVAGAMGYSMHLGNNSSLVSVEVPIQLDISMNSDTLHAVMNINEWFRNPNPYDIILDGNHIMGDQNLMSKFAANGHDVFTVFQ